MNLLPMYGNDALRIDGCECKVWMSFYLTLTYSHTFSKAILGQVRMLNYCWVGTSLFHL